MRDGWGVEGEITAVYSNLGEAEAAGVITDAREWLAAQERPPKTPVEGFRYRVKPARGAMLCGEDDLEHR